MGRKHIPISAAKRLADQLGLRQVIIIAQNADDDTVHVVTYGQSLEDCCLAAESGNNLKRHMGWPETECQSMPTRMTKRNLIEP